MDGIKLLIEEHVNIKRMLEVIRKASYGILKGEAIDYEDFSQMIDFVRSYADAHHHGKEEQFLFDKMISELGGAAEKLVKYGMLVEHDLGRLHMKDLEDALIKVKEGDDEAKIDVVANAVSYANLLTRHISKEDLTVFPFAQRSLKGETIETINLECENFEVETGKDDVQKKYLELLVTLENKYCS